MAILNHWWLITSDITHEAAFRIDLPGPDRGRWVLSYLPTYWRLTADQACAGVVLAEMLILRLVRPTERWDGEIAAAYAAELGLSVTDVMCLLALRGVPDAAEGMASGTCASERPGRSFVDHHPGRRL